ncbi:MAG: FlgD immunoglobulin-like domain containing protein [Candidatus Eisenbacteria bacterium]
MRLASLLLALACSHAITTTASATIAVHGLNQDPLGAATLSVSGSASTGYELLVANIGSSGNDGVSVALPGSNGFSLTYGATAFDPLAARIVHRDLACRAISGGLPLTIAKLIENEAPTGSGVILDAQLVGSPDVLIELFNGPVLVYSSKRGYAYYQAHSSLSLSGPGVAVDEPGVSVSMRFGRPVFNTALNRSCTIAMVRPTPCEATFDGTTKVADRVEISFAMLAPITGDLRCVSADLRVIGAGGGGSGGSVGRLAIKTKGLPCQRSSKKGRMQSVTVSALAGVTLQNASGAGDTQRIRVVPNSGDPVPDPPAVSLWGLPPGTPILTRALEEMRVRLHGPTFEMPTGQSLTVQANMVRAGGIAAGAIAAIVVACTALGPTSFSWSASSDDPGQGFHYELYRGPRQTTSLDGTYEPRSSTKARQHVVRCESGQCSMGFGMPPGSTITAGGVVYDADSLVVVFDGTTDPAIGVTDEVWRPSLGTQYTMLLTEGAAVGTTANPPPRNIVVWGGMRIKDESDGTRTLSNIGSSGEDGVSYFTNGLGSVRIPFANGFELAPGVGLRLEADDCDDGECQAISSLQMRRPSGGALGNSWTLTCIMRMQGTNPLYGEANNRVTDWRDLDSDGDGLPEVHAMPGSTVSLASVGYRHLGPYRECWEMRFKQPVRIIRSGQPETIDAGKKLVVWRNIGGQPIGEPAPMARVISLNGLPPGEPWIATYSGIQTEGVTMSGTGTDNQLAHNTIAGWPVVPTWTTVSGPIVIHDLDGDGVTLPELERVRVRNAAGTLDPSPALLTSVWDPDPTDYNCDGYVFGAALDSIVVGSDTLRIAVSVGGTVGGAPNAKTASFDVRASPGGASARITYDHALVASSVECDAYLGGVLQSTFRYTGGITCGTPPIIVQLHTPPGSGGALYGECQFRSGTFLQAGGVIVVLDRLVFRPATDVVVAVVSSASVSLYGLPPGQPVTNVQLAAIVPENVILAAPGGGAGAAPVRFALSQASPNPMYATSAVRFALPAKQHVRAVVMDVAGRQVARLADQEYEAGEHTLRWNGMGEGGAPAPAGLYFVRVERGGEAKIARVTRLK